MIKIYDNKGSKQTRTGFGDAILKLAEKNSKIVALCSDLTESLCLTKFSKKYPNRFFQIGIAEANMICIASGMSISGYIPYTGTFANFSTSRVYDQIRQSIAYSNKNVKICASHSGLTLGEDGATHQSLEDIGLMKMLPGLVVINTCDYNQTYSATLSIANYYGPVYLRFGRPSVPNFTEIDYNFQIGKAIKLVEGSDVTLLCTGHLVWECLLAAKELYYNNNITCEVINIHTIKPLDKETIINSIKKTGCVITAEEHNYLGGMGESISSLLSRYLPMPQEFIAVKDTFGESGKPEELMNKYGLNKKSIIEKVKLVINRKINKF